MNKRVSDALHKASSAADAAGGDKARWPGRGMV